MRAESAGNDTTLPAAEETRDFACFVVPAGFAVVLSSGQDATITMKQGERQFHVRLER